LLLSFLLLFEVEEESASALPKDNAQTTNPATVFFDPRPL